VFSLARQGRKTLGELPTEFPTHLHSDAEVTAALKETLGEQFLITLFEVLRARVVVFDAIAEHENRRRSASSLPVADDWGT
jgi:hypothetical protein